MSISTLEVLAALRDIEGVLGSFLIDLDGHLLARDVPPLFNLETLARSGLHLARLRAALESAGSGFDSCVARFGPHLLLLRAAYSTTLCVLCPHGTNMAAVQMSSTLVARRLYGPNPNRPSSPPPARTPLDDPPEAATNEPARRFRGRSL
ncbi:MAG: hypothetical protein JWN04_4804 [Myxococcaceae bacterium]|nr:hypothetical protein [Myxococcaceae bacterium]